MEKGTLKTFFFSRCTFIHVGFIHSRKFIKFYRLGCCVHRECLIGKCSSRSIRVDLGQGCFPSRFADHGDLQKVLDNRPCKVDGHSLAMGVYNRDLFSQIPFWIQVQGVLVYLWSGVKLRSIGEDLGTFEAWEITASKVRLRVWCDINVGVWKLRKALLPF